MAYKDPLDPRNRAARRKHYYANKEQYYERNRVKKVQMKAWITEIKSIPCMDCNESFPDYCMDLHHRDADDKVDVIGRMILKGSWKKLKEEVEKCDIICAICHRKRHYRDKAEVAG